MGGEAMEPQIIDKRSQKAQIAAQRAQVATNVSNLAGATWWRAQGAAQRGDTTEESRYWIARTRLLAESRRQGLRV